MTACENTDIPAVSSSAVEAEDAVLCLINEARASENVPPLSLNAKLRTAAREHAMAAATIKWWPSSGDSGHVPHVNPVTGKDEQERIKEAGYCTINPDGVPRNENAYAAYFTGDVAQYGAGTTPAAAVDWWLHSEGHRRTLLDPQYKETGVGVVRGTASMGLPADADGAIFIQTFGGCAEIEPIVPTQLWAWGANGNGQLGDGSAENAAKSPVHPSDFEDFIGIAASHHSVGVKQDGSVWTWGPRENKGTVPGGSDVPVRVKGLDQVTAVAAGYEHNLAIRTDGSVWAWGDNRYGQLGDGSGADQETPVRVRNLTGVVAVAAGDGHSLAIRADGSVWGWGSNGDAQLGHDPISPYEEFKFPTRITSLQNRTVAIAAGTYHTLVLEEGGQMWLFGLNIAGCIGTGEPDRLFYQDPTKPAPVDGFTGMDIVSIAASFDNSYAVDKSGHVWAWGDNAFHQLGPNIDVGLRDGLAHRVTGLSNIVSVSAGGFHCLAVTRNGDLWSWGSNSAGQVGQGAVIGPDRPPHQITNLDNVSSCSGGYLHSLASGHRGE
jgi:alpha-tubulin suppressor-like RCC1 family protein/uncharacterized protein YkwD